MTYLSMTLKERQDSSNELKKWLLDQRLVNEDYDPVDWTILKNKATYLRNKLRKTQINLKVEYGILERLTKNKFNRFNYEVGESFSREYVTLLEIFTEKES